MTTGAPVAVVGAGAAGLLAALRLAERGIPVDLFSLGAPTRGPVASAGRGLAAGDDPDLHLEDALAASGGAADVPALRAMIGAAPRLVDELSRLGVPFDRGSGGAMVGHGAVGHRSPRVVEAALATSFHAVHALDSALRSCAAAAVRRFEGWEMIALILEDGGSCVGLVAQDLRTMEVRGVAASAVVLASGGFAGAWGGGAAGSGAVGTAIAAAARAGALLVDPDRIDVQPLAWPGADKPRPVPDCLRALGARVWTAKDPQDRRRPRDIPGSDRRVLLEGGADAPRREEAARVLAGAGSPGNLYLDATHLGALRLSDRLGRAALDLERAGAESLAVAPLAVVPAVHATLGGLWTSRPVVDAGASHPSSCATTVPGLYAIGGAAASPTGTARLAGHRLLHGVFGADRVAGAAAAHREASGARAAEAGRRAIEQAARTEAEAHARAMQRGGGEETVDDVITAVGDALRADAGILGHPGSAAALAAGLPSLHARSTTARALDRATFMNRGAPARRRLDAALLLAGAVAAAAGRRHGALPPGGPVAVRLDGSGPRVVDQDPTRGSAGSARDAGDAGDAG